MFTAYCHWFPDLDSLSKKGRATGEILIQYVLLPQFKEFQEHHHIGQEI